MGGTGFQPVKAFSGTLRESDALSGTQIKSVPPTPFSMGGTASACEGLFGDTSGVGRFSSGTQTKVCATDNLFSMGGTGFSL